MQRIAAAALGLAVLTAGPAMAKCGKDEAYCQYRKEVDRETAKTYKREIDTVDPARLRGKAQGYDLDHERPVKCGYAYKVPAKEMAMAENLRVIPSAQNRSEGARGCK